jgi:SNF2 family DNA or RNA helicase
MAQMHGAAPTRPKFIITSYETLESIRENLENLPIAAIYFDESSKIKNSAAQRTKTAHALVNSMPWVKRFCLSGTPSTKNPLGFYSQYELLAKNSTGFGSYSAFEKHYAITKLYMNVRLPSGKVIGIDIEEDPQGLIWLNARKPWGSSQTYAELGYSFARFPKTPEEIKILGFYRRNVKFINEQDLHATTQKMAYTLFKKDVLPELPEKIYQQRLLELSDAQKKAYHEVLAESRTTIQNIPFSFSDIGSPYAKMHQIANGYILKQGQPVFFSSQPKLNELEQILEEAGDQKIIIWSPFLAQIQQVLEFTEKQGLKALTLTGKDDSNSRQTKIHAFQNDPETQVFIANPAVGGLGLNLTCSSLEIFMTNWFTPDSRIQAEDRCHRLGQKNAVTIIDLVSAGTLEPGVLENTRREINLERKIISMSFLTGGKSNA